MAESTTARLGLPRWSAQTDTPNRAEFDGAMASLEANAMMFAQGTLVARPAAGKAGRTYTVINDGGNTGQVWYDTGTTWLMQGSNVLDQRIFSSGTGVVSQIIRALTNQTAVLTQWLKSDGNIGASVDVTGKGLFSSLQSLGTLAVAGITTLTGRLDANGGVSTTTLQTSGDVTAQRIRSSSQRADGGYQTDLALSGGARLDGLIPPGVVVQSVRTGSVPAGWLLCDGSAVSRTTYVDLFNAIGTQFGGGDGSTTFNLPDFRYREVRGAGPDRAVGVSDNLAVGSRVARLGHDIDVSGSTGSAGSHSHGIPGQDAGIARTYAGGSGNSSPAQVSWDGHNHGGVTTASGTHTHSVSVGASCPEHPHLYVNFLIRT